MGIFKAGSEKGGKLTWELALRNKAEIGFEAMTVDPAQSTIRLIYSIGEWAGRENESLDYLIRLTTTRPWFGGLRWWFICPLVIDGVVCNRRVGKLYLPPKAPYFGCRHCYCLTYRSCQESHVLDRDFRQIAKDLGWKFDDVKRAMKELFKCGIGD